MTIIKKILLWGVLCYIIPLQAQTDSLVISPFWYTLQNEKLSSDGEWASVLKVYENNADTIYILNSKSGIKKEITGLGTPKFVGDYMVGIDSKDFYSLRIIPLKKGKERLYKNIQKYLGLEKHNALVSIKTDSVFKLEKLGVNANQVLLEQKGITGFEINEKQTYGVLYSQLGEELHIYGIDLTTLKVKEILKLKGNLSYDKVWNDSEDKLLLQTIDKQLLYLDIETGGSKIISLENEDKIVELKADFSTDDKLLIRTTIKTDELNDYLEHVDIWNGNDRQLDRKSHLTKDSKYVAKNFVYDPTIDVWIDIKVKDKQELVFIKNANFAVVLDRWKYIDYSHYYPLMDIYIKDLKSGEQYLIAEKIANSNSNFAYAPNGKYVAYKQEDVWTGVEVSNKKRYSFKDSSISNTISSFSLWEWIWGADGDSAYIVGNQLWKVDLKTGQKIALTNFEQRNLDLKLISVNLEDRIFYDSGIAYSISALNANLVLLTHNPQNHEYSLYTVNAKNQLVLAYQTSNKVSKVNWSTDFKTFVFNEENFNLPPRVLSSEKGKAKILLENQQPKELYEWRKQRIHHFKNKQGEDLQGILYYPKNFDPKKKYPMITYIYQIQNIIANEFLIPSLQNSDGFNEALSLDLGYFIYLPDILETEEGSGLSALDCVTRGVTLISELEPSINKEKLGLIGDSFGGFETNFIITQTNLFATAVSGVAPSDLMWDYYSYNYNFRNSLHWRYENNSQLMMRGSFKEQGEKFLRNSPLRYAHQIKTPLLAWTGLEDFNVHWEHTRHFYTALKRYEIPHIALFYKEEGHAIMKKSNQYDLTQRVLNWFDYYLKDKKEVEWIAKGVDYSL